MENKIIPGRRNIEYCQKNKQTKQPFKQDAEYVVKKVVTDHHGKYNNIKIIQ